MKSSTNIKVSMVIVVLIVSSVLTYADNDYLAGTRGEGIGFAYSALADEPTGALYNPSGAAFIKGWQAQMQYQNPTDYGLSVIEESAYGGLAGFNYYHESLGNIVLNSHQFGSFSEPTSITTLSSLNLSYARLINEQWAAGAGFKYMMESNFSDRSVFDLDLGLTWRPMAKISLAAVGENLLKAELTPAIAGFSQHLSRKFRLAGAYHYPKENFSASLIAGWQLEQAGEIETNNTSLFNAGTELWFGTHSDVSLGLRGGYTYGKSTVYIAELDYNRWSGGASINFDFHGRDLRIDYAIRSFPFESTEDLVVDHSLSFTYGWGGIPDYYGQHMEDTYDLTRYEKEQTWQAPVVTGEESFSEMGSGQTFSGRDVSPKKKGYARLNLETEATQLITGSKPRLVFYLRPDGLLKLSGWKLYIFTAKMKDWQEDAVDDFAVHVIEGKGITPLTVIWNGQLANGSFIKPGKYYFVVVGDDSYGEKYMSKWSKFKIE
ncbi:MAG: hypothetical protein GY839_07950 [candidate division Zixibacteria bacterium]|nr:hypothetical protein [candidate division Zixibacteria bacterium]